MAHPGVNLSAESPISSLRSEIDFFELDMRCTNVHAMKQRSVGSMRTCPSQLVSACHKHNGAPTRRSVSFIRFWGLLGSTRGVEELMFLLYVHILRLYFYSMCTFPSELVSACHEHNGAPTRRSISFIRFRGLLGSTRGVQQGLMFLFYVHILRRYFYSMCTYPLELVLACRKHIPVLPRFVR